MTSVTSTVTPTNAIAATAKTLGQCSDCPNFTKGNHDSVGYCRLYDEFTRSTDIPGDLCEVMVDAHEGREAQPWMFATEMVKPSQLHAGEKARYPQSMGCRGWMTLKVPPYVLGDTVYLSYELEGSSNQGGINASYVWAGPDTIPFVRFVDEF